MQLNFIRSGSGPNLVILHGLFGMLDNWKTVGKELEKNFTVYLVDQRNHGKSPHVPEHSYSLMADDLQEFFTQQQISKSHILGHSMGGKTAMQFALDHSDLVDKLIIVDMGIKRYPAGHDAIFDALHKIELKKVHTRKDAEQMLENEISDSGVRQFVLKNLTRNTDGSYNWKFNLTALDNNYETEILAPVKSDHNYSGDVLFIRGVNSNYILDEDWREIQKLFPKSELITVQNAGHWVHADQPQQLINTVLTFLAK